MALSNITSGLDERPLEDFNQSAVQAFTGESELTLGEPSGYSVAPKYFLNRTLDASGEVSQVTGDHLAKYSTAVKVGLDKSLLGRAKSIIESFSDSDVMETTINLESLRGIVLQLWESATSSTQFHQEILAILESALLSVESLNENQLSVFREAIADLERDVLAQVHVDIIRRQFISKGFSPLALLSEIEDVDGND